MSAPHPQQGGGTTAWCRLPAVVADPSGYKLERLVGGVELASLIEEGKGVSVASEPAFGGTDPGEPLL